MQRKRGGRGGERERRGVRPVKGSSSGTGGGSEMETGHGPVWSSPSSVSSFLFCVYVFVPLLASTNKG